MLRTPANLLLFHKSLGVLTNQFNLIGRNFLLVTVNNLILFIIVICNVAFILFHNSLAIEAVVILATGSLLGTTSLVIIYIKFGEINTGSRKYLVSWRKTLKDMNANDRKLMEKYMNSCRPLQIKLGNFGYYPV